MQSEKSRRTPVGTSPEAIPCASLNLDLAKCYRHAHFTTLPPVLSRGFSPVHHSREVPAAPMGFARSRRRHGKPPGHPAAQRHGKHHRRRRCRHAQPPARALTAVLPSGHCAPLRGCSVTCEAIRARPRAHPPPARGRGRTSEARGQRTRNAAAAEKRTTAKSC